MNMSIHFDPEKIIISVNGVLAGDLLLVPMKEILQQDISFANEAWMQPCVQEWQPADFARGAGLLSKEIFGLQLTS